MGKRYEALLSSASAHAAHTMSAFQPQSVVCSLSVASGIGSIPGCPCCLNFETVNTLAF